MICAVICCVKDKLLKFWEATIMPLVLPIKKWKYFLLFLICSSVSVMACVRSKIVCVLSFVFWCVWEARLVIVLLFWPKSSMYTGVCHGGMYFLESCSYLVSQQQKRAFESFVWEWENVAYFLSILYCSHLHCVLIKRIKKTYQSNAYLLVALAFGVIFISLTINEDDELNVYRSHSLLLLVMYARGNCWELWET